MFGALLAHPQEALYKRQLYYVRVTSDGCARIGAVLQSWRSHLTQHARNILTLVCIVPPEDDKVMLETYRGP
jgi:hypothetical protein